MSTVHHCEVAHALETKERDETNCVLQERLKKYTEKIDCDFFLPGCPDGYEPNNGRVSTQIPVEGGYYVNAKYVQLRDDGRVLLLAGKEHQEEPYAAELYIDPNYSSPEPMEPMPIWFHSLLIGPSPAFHTLHCAVANLDDWNASAEVKRYWHNDDRLRHLCDQLTIIQAEVHLLEDNLSTCCHHIEAGCVLSKVPNLKGRAWANDYLAACRCTVGRGAHRGPGGPK
jgi:hypothetical protein